MSKGCIVVVPYLLAEDGPDPDYPDVIVSNLVRIFTKVGLVVTLQMYLLL